MFLVFAAGFVDLFVIYWVGKDFAVHPAPFVRIHCKEVVLGFNHSWLVFRGSCAPLGAYAIPE